MNRDARLERPSRPGPEVQDDGVSWEDDPVAASVPRDDLDLDGDLHAVERPRILIIDDSPTIRAMLVSLLRDEHEVLMAKEGESSLSMAAERPHPDLILLDVEMPGIDGFEVCRRLKDSPVTRDIPVVFLTSLSDVEHERRGLLLGAADYIAKPISPPPSCWLGCEPTWP